MVLIHLKNKHIKYTAEKGDMGWGWKWGVWAGGGDGKGGLGWG